MPPSIVLEVMRILEKEIGLREETRVLEQARAAVPVEVHAASTAELAETQGGLSERVSAVTRKIAELKDGEASFPRELAMLRHVEEVMAEAQGLLSQCNTGPPTIAAETEVIELLLQTQRSNPKSSGGGGGSTPGGGGTGTTDESALALVGSGNEREARPVEREVAQATGRAGAELPAEFRAGLDAFFETLEKSREIGTIAPVAK